MYSSRTGKINDASSWMVFRLPQRRGAFQAHAEASEFKKLLSYGKEVNDGFAKPAKATMESCRLTMLPRRIKSKLEN